ncbi:MAG: hypothetical protein AAFZ18_16300 [Myxococcota bacterium]
MKCLGLAIALLVAPMAGTGLASETRILVVGGGAEGDPGATLASLRKRMEGYAPEHTVLVFVGNYLKRGELPSPSDRDRDAAENSFEPYLETARALLDRGGRVYFLPGDRDYRSDRKGPRRLRRFLEEALQPEDDEADDDALSVMPVSDCAQPVVVELNDGVTVLAFVNSQWWMQDFDEDPKANQGCELKRRDQLSYEVEGIVKKYRTKRLVVFSHHPLRSNGPYGGQFGPVDYLWPPVLGLFAVIGKQAGLLPQYLGHPLYASYADSVQDAAQKFGAIVFASGHDRSLQVLEAKKQLQIVSGAGSEDTSRVNTPSNPQEHATSTPGWAEISVLPGGEGEVTLVAAPSGETLFRRALPDLPSFVPEEPPPAERDPGPVTSTYTRSSFGTTNAFEGFFLGRHYRDAFDLDLEFEQLQLADRGFTPIKVGGGAQTNSLRLLDPEGGQWSLRAATKDSSRFLPYPLGKISIVTAVVDDAFTAAHPEAALAVPPLAEAVGIFHTRPRLLYVPDQRALEPYRAYLSDEVALLERRPEEIDGGQLPDHLGGSAGHGEGKVKYDSSVKVLEKLRAKPWKYSVDQENMLRARLLDMLLGDWDRHEDQWRWVRIPQSDGTKVFRPIPRDRDQVFAHYDGLVLALGRLVAPDIRVLGTFGEDIGDPTWLNYGARHIDSHFLNAIERKRWLAVAAEVQAAVTDDLIEASVGRLHPKAVELDGETIAKKLRSRRDGLLKAAERFYAQLNEKVVVLGSEKRDLVHVTYETEGKVRVQLRRAKKGPSSPPYYDRLFLPDDTKEVHIYTFSGKDELEVFGKPHGRVRVRFLGGRKKDVVRAGNPGEGRLRAKGLSVYDLPDGLNVEGSIDVDDQRSTHPYRNQYDRKDPHYEPTKVGFIPGLLVNPDDGVYLGGILQTSHPGFKRRPFDIQHTFSAYFATATLGVSGSYDALIPNSLLGADQRFGLAGTTPQFTRNFFGLTNTFVDPSSDRDQFRLRQSTLEVHYGLSELASRLPLEVGFDLEGIFVDTERTEGRNIAMLADTGAIDVRALTSRYYLGGSAWLRLDSRDNAAYPKRGLFGEVFASTRVDLTEDDGSREFDTLGLFGGSAGGIFPFDGTGRVVLSTWVRAQGIIGDYQFYWAPTLGSSEIRAYNDEQLAGDFVFSHSTDLRFEVIRIARGLPSVIGIAGAIDHGRAFGTDVPGNEYHASAGGTLFWNIADLAGLGVSYHVGFRDPGQRQRFMVLLGPLFSDTGFR